MTYHVEVVLTNETEGYRFNQYDEPIGEHLLRGDGTPHFGDLFRAMRTNFGRCQSSVYVDTPEGGARRVGWYFQARDRYEDTNDRYLRGAWVTVIAKTPPDLVTVP